jgi:hypothetical protein
MVIEAALTSSGWCGEDQPVEGLAVGAMRDAGAETGADDFGDEWFMGPLGAWAADLEQANLTEFGRRFLASLAVRDLARRLRVLETFRNHPDIASVPMPRIVYITGLNTASTPTGSTSHNANVRHVLRDLSTMSRDSAKESGADRTSLKPSRRSFRDQPLSRDGSAPGSLRGADAQR